MYKGIGGLCLVACIPWVLNFAVSKQQYNLLKGVSYYYFDVEFIIWFLDNNRFEIFGPSTRFIYLKTDQGGNKEL